MYEYGEKHPIIFEIILIVVSFLAAAMLTIAGSIVGASSDFSSAVARTIVGIVLIAVFARYFKGERPFRNLIIVVPALLFAAWNIFYNLSSGMEFGGTVYFIEAAVLAIAPAIYEEVLFRGIFIHNLKASGLDELKCMLISAAVFAVIHFTNAVGQDLATVALQVGYALVVGMVFGAIYIKNGSIVQVIAAHFLIDATNHLFIEAPSESSELQIALFVVLLVAEAAYALWLTRKPQEG